MTSWHVSPNLPKIFNHFSIILSLFKIDIVFQNVRVIVFENKSSITDKCMYCLLNFTNYLNLSELIFTECLHKKNTKKWL